MEPIIKLPLSAVSFVFSQISEMQSKVSWLRSPDYANQLYVSPSYEKIWGIKPEKLYEHPLSWNDTLVKEDIVTQLINRMPNSNTTVYFQIYDAMGNLKFMKDTCFHIFGGSSELVAVGGISEEVSATQWEHELGKIKIRYDETDIITDILDQIVKPSLSPPNTDTTQQKHSKVILTTQGATVKFTQRESDCLECLAAGLSAKQIARKLLISPRTVEVHIDNMKNKLGCRSRLELISKLNSH